MAEKRNQKKIELIDLKEILFGITADPRGWNNPIIFKESGEEDGTNRSYETP